MDFKRVSGRKRESWGRASHWPTGHGFSTRAFSLIEEVLALAIVSFALISVMGLIPVGLHTFRTANGISTESQIVQSLSRDVYLMDLQQSKSQSIFFDNNGDEVKEGSPEVLFKVDLQVDSPQGPGFEEIAAGLMYRVVISVTNLTMPGIINRYPVLVANNHQN